MSTSALAVNPMAGLSPSYSRRPRNTTLRAHNDNVLESAGFDDDTEEGCETTPDSALALETRRPWKRASLRGGRLTTQRRASAANGSNAETKENRLVEASVVKSENGQLKEIVASQLRLLQHQSKDIASKESRLNRLKLENEALKERLRGLKQPDDVNLGTLGREQGRLANPIPSSKKSRFSLKSCSLPEVKSPENREKTAFIETKTPYFLLAGSESSDARNTTESTSSEVPAFREHLVSGSNSADGAEDLDDGVFGSRHRKPEADEKRLKKWDIQLLREQCKIARLRARHEGGARDPLFGVPGRGAGRKKRPVESITTLLPQPAEATHLQVAERLPVTAFGHQLPLLEKTTFCLPWAKSNTSQAKSRRHSLKAQNTSKEDP